MREHNGLYQGIVVSSNDPKHERRLTAKVPDVLGETISNWARPASIIDSPLLPGDPVWIHWPNGDFRYPVYHVFNDPKWGRIVPTRTNLGVNGPGAAGVQLNSGVHAQGDGGYVNVYATDFIKVSDPSLKKNIRDLEFDPVQAVMDAPVYAFEYRFGGHSSVGPMRGDLPEVAQVGDVHVSEGTLIGILWGAVRQLTQEVEQLRAERGTPNSEAPANTLGKDV